ncbi:MAG: hypothetical protein Q8908_04450 [Bacteroidota bacterium]|nr:hypothetical protein [Bacteroidota bacterium]
MRNLRKLFLLILFFIPLLGAAQFYSLGQDPGSTKWRQINSENFKLIYPQQFEGKAQQFINLLENSRKYTPLSLGAKVPRMPVVLHTQDITANAFSVWAPRRIELYTAPPQSTYAQPWFEQLAIHEYRHSVQLSAMNTGLTKLMGYAMGEQAAAGVLGLYLPFWFVEGDAVTAETALSNSGRGRVPSFSMELRAQLLENGHYSYDKAVNGSYRNYIPDYYMLGYEMVARARQIKSDPDVWSKTLRFVGRNPYLPWAFNRGLKKSLGMTKESLYLNTVNDLKEKWSGKTEVKSDENIVSPAKKNFTRYKFPHYVNDSTWISERITIDDIDRFVITHRNGKEETAFTPGMFSSDNISFSGSDHTGVMGTNKPGSITADNLDLQTNRLFWTEKNIDPRWQNRSYSIIKCADLNTGKWFTLTHKSRYFSPSVSPDGSLLAVSEVSEANNYSILLIDSYNGEVKKKVISSDTDFYINPTWSADSKFIYCVVMNEDGKKLVRVDVNSGDMQTLIGSSYYEISNPCAVGKYVFFNAAYTGIDNIFALNVENGKIFQVTDARFGAIDIQASPDRKHMAYSDYNSKGYRIAEVQFNPESWPEYHPTPGNQPEGLYSATISKQEGAIVTDATSSKKEYVSTPYNRFTNSFNLHSWAPFYFNTTNYNLGSGISLMSQDVLSTMFVTLQQQFRDANGFARTSAAVSYQALYPIFDISVERGKNTSAYRYSNDLTLYPYVYDETIYSAAVKMPLKFSVGPTNFGIQPLMRASLKDMVPDLSSPLKSQLSNKMTTLEYQLYSFVYRKYGLRDLAPRWGLVNNFVYGTTPSTGVQSGTILAIEETAYLPGILHHDGFRIYMGYQDRQKGSTGSFDNIIIFPRGNSVPLTDNEVSLSFNYALPLLYPDISLGPVAYIKRIKGNFFYDTTLKNVIGGKGVELTADVHLLRFVFPFELGIQYVMANNGSITVSPLISINLSGI